MSKLICQRKDCKKPATTNFTVNIYGELWKLFLCEEHAEEIKQVTLKWKRRTKKIVN